MGDVGTDRGDPVDVADGVLGQAATPALHVGVDDAWEGAAEGLGDLRDRDGDEVGVVTLEVGLLARPPERGAQVHDLVGELAGPGPLAEAEGARLDRAALDRGHEEPRAGQVGRGRPAPRRASRPRWTRSRRRPAPRRRPGRGRPAGATPPGRGNADDDGIGRQRPRGRRRSRRRGASPRRCAAAHARRHRCAASHPRRASSSATSSGRRPTPPRRPVKGGRGRLGAAAGVGCRARRRARRPGSRPRSPAPRAPASSPAGTAGGRGRRRPRRARARRAGRRRRRRAGHRRSRRPRRPRSSAPSGQGCSWRSRSTSSSVRMPRADSGSVGTPISVARGSGRRAPLVHTEAAVVAGATRSSAAPTRFARSTASGRSGQHRLRADVDEVPGDRLEAQLAAQPVAALEHRDVGRRERVEHLERGGEAGDAAAHDDDAGPGGHGRDRHVTQPLTQGRNPRRAPVRWHGSGARRESPGPAGTAGSEVSAPRWTRGRGRDRRRSRSCPPGPPGTGS